MTLSVSTVDPASKSTVNTENISNLLVNTSTPGDVPSLPDGKGSLSSSKTSDHHQDRKLPRPSENSFKSRDVPALTANGKGTLSSQSKFTTPFGKILPGIVPQLVLVVY